MIREGKITGYHPATKVEDEQVHAVSKTVTVTPYPSEANTQIRNGISWGNTEKEKEVNIMKDRQVNIYTSKESARV